MTAAGWAQIAIVIAAVGLLVKPFGTYIYRVFEDEQVFGDRAFKPVERVVFRFLGIDKDWEHGWAGYVTRLLILDFSFMLFAYIVLRLQGHLPLNPAGAPGMNPDLAFNTAVSFGTNTNWQAYAGETQASYLSQMIVITTLMFTSAASGMILAIAFLRGLSREKAGTIGNLYVDFIRAVLRVLLPLAVVMMVVLLPLGVANTLKGPAQVQTLEGETQEIARGPVASLESIKHIGNNGGGFFNANASHPLENPNPVTNIIFVIAMFMVPASMVYVLGLYLRSKRQGWIIFLTLLVLFLVVVGLTYWFEARGDPQTRELGINTSAGNMEGKETRNGVAGSSLFESATVSATTGSVNSSHDSFTPLGGMMLLAGMMLNTIFGSCGAGLLNILMYVIFTVFIAGLMVGRTPEFHGKKIEGREVKLAVIALLAHPLCILGFTALSMAIPVARDAILNQGPHGLTEVAYAFTSATANNGSAFAGLAANTAYFNITTGIAMLVGRYIVIVPMMAVAGSLVRKPAVPPSEGTFRTDTALFAGLLVGVILIVGALTFFPVLALGPLADSFAL
jgi:potassium-transporting ATPase potassium-binding subunit